MTKRTKKIEIVLKRDVQQRFNSKITYLCYLDKLMLSILTILMMHLLNPLIDEEIFCQHNNSAIKMEFKRYLMKKIAPLTGLWLFI